MRTFSLRLVLGVSVAGLVPVAACVGDDPDLAATPLDGSDTSDGAVSDQGQAPVDAPGADVLDASTFEPKVSTGFALSCAIVRSGKVFCWGENAAGQAGADPALGAQMTPREVVGIADAVEIAAGGDHACAVTRAGNVLCWGANDMAQLGAPRDAGAQSETAVAVQGIPDRVTRISAADSSTCAVTMAGAVFCWGTNPLGELGADPATTTSSLPRAVAVAGVSFQDIAMKGGSVCAAKGGSPGQLFCWGDNFGLQLGRAPSSTFEAPGLASGLGNYDPPGTLGVGSLHTCIHLSQPIAAQNAGVRCWGQNLSGVLGTAIAANASTATPVKIPGLENDVARVVIGFVATCGLTTGGALRCVGDPASLGQPNATVVNTPVDVIAAGVAQASIGSNHGCAVLAASGPGDTKTTIHCWGRGERGQLGRGVGFDAGGSSVHAPAPVSGLP